MEEQQPAIQTPQVTPPPLKKKRGFLLIVLLILLLLVSIICFLFFRQRPQQFSITTPTATPTPSQTLSPIPTQTPKTAQKNWKLFNPSDHTFIAADKSFRFTYPADWVYETIDGIIPQQQHIVYLGKLRTENERKALAEKTGAQLDDSFGSISRTTQNIFFVYTDTPEFQVKSAEALACGNISEKKDILIDKTTPGLQVTADCYSETFQVVFTKNQSTFTFNVAKNPDTSFENDKRALEETIAHFTFSK